MTPQTIEVLRVLLAAPSTSRYGLEIARTAGLKTGTVHPILARLQQVGWIDSFWETPVAHEDQGRPRRRYYRLTGDGVPAARRAIAVATAPGAPGLSGLRPHPGY
ncbi:MAG: PadR family transcriptional regulator [Pseudonocardiaceae bacterium]